MQEHCYKLEWSQQRRPPQREDCEDESTNSRYEDDLVVITASPKLPVCHIPGCAAAAAAAAEGMKQGSQNGDFVENGEGRGRLKVREAGKG